LINICMDEISYEYIRGLIDGEGCFTFSTSGNYKIPTFSIGMSIRDYDLLVKVRDRLRLKNRIYKYKPWIAKDGYNRMGKAILIVRDLGQLKNIIIPLCYGKMIGHKRIQLEDWIVQIRADNRVLDSFKSLSYLYDSGYFDKNHTIFH